MYSYDAQHFVNMYNDANVLTMLVSCTALNDALREEVQRLKIATGQMANMNGTTMNRGLQQSAAPYFPHQQQLHNQSGHHNQQLQGSHQSPNGQALSDQSLHDSMDFM